MTLTTLICGFEDHDQFHSRYFTYSRVCLFDSSTYHSELRMLAICSDSDYIDVVAMDPFVLWHTINYDQFIEHTKAQYIH